MIIYGTVYFADATVRCTENRLVMSVEVWEGDEGHLDGYDETSMTASKMKEE